MRKDTTASSGSGMSKSRGGRRLSVVPVVMFAALSLLLGYGLTLRPRDIPSALIGKPAPDFDLPPVKGRTLGFSSRDLQGHVSLVNVFASWCVACREEHPILMGLAAEGAIPVYGLNYKDAPDDAAKWLDAMGDPYRRTGADVSGRVAIEWGVYGVPETYVVDAAGRILHKQIGPLTRAVVDSTIRPYFESHVQSGGAE